jgi:hypothetical protein
VTDVRWRNRSGDVGESTPGPATISSSSQFVTPLDLTGITFAGLNLTGGTIAGLPIAGTVNTTWTPVITFATPGDLSVTYSTQVGNSTRVGDLVVDQFVVATSAFTHTTASGNLILSGRPYTSAAGSSFNHFTSCVVGGYTKANYTSVCLNVGPASTTILFQAYGSGQTPANLTAADMPTGGSVVLRGAAIYRAS